VAIPRANNARSYVTGGDVGYTRGPDGARQRREDRSSTWVQLTLPASGPFTICSSVRDVPAVADLVTARYHAEPGRAVTVSTPAAISTLEAGVDPATGSRLVWSYKPRVPQGHPRPRMSGGRHPIRERRRRVHTRTGRCRRT
jgi:hypothetical protein